MKLLVLSDLHMEFAPFAPDPQAVQEADVVVLAGDIDKGVKGIRWAAETFPGKPVIYVAGNHEFYGGNWDTTMGEMRAEAKAVGIHFLENDSVEIDGLRFLGCSLWTNFEYFGRDRRHGAMMDVQNGMNDFKFIKAEPLKDVYWKTKRHRLTALHVLRRHEESLAWLRGELPRGNLARTVVVVHHAPRAESVPEIYTDHPLTPGYASRLPDELLLGAGLWIHGHIHDSCDYLVAGRTRVVCNPRGYLVAGRGIENRTFNPGLLLSVYRRGGGSELIVTHLNAPYGPVVQKEHLEQALRTGTLEGLPTGPAAIVSSLFVECDPYLILRCAQEIGAPVASVNKLYDECCCRVPTVRLPAWEDAVAHLFARPPTDTLRLAALAPLYAAGEVTWRQVADETNAAFGELLLELGRQGLKPPIASAEKTPELARLIAPGVYETLVDYSLGRLPRRVAMEALGLDWYGDLLDMLGAAGLSQPIVPAAQRAEMVEDMLSVLREAGVRVERRKKESGDAP